MSQEKLNGEVVLVAASLPSMYSLDWVTPMLSAALTIIVRLPETVALLTGAVMETVGLVVSVDEEVERVVTDKIAEETVAGVGVALSVALTT